MVGGHFYQELQIAVEKNWRHKGREENCLSLTLELNYNVSDNAPKGSSVNVSDEGEWSIIYRHPSFLCNALLFVLMIVSMKYQPVRLTRHVSISVPHHRSRVS